MSLNFLREAEAAAILKGTVKGRCKTGADNYLNWKQGVGRAKSDVISGTVGQESERIR